MDLIEREELMRRAETPVVVFHDESFGMTQDMVRLIYHEWEKRWTAETPHGQIQVGTRKYLCMGTVKDANDEDAFHEAMRPDVQEAWQQRWAQMQRRGRAVDRLIVTAFEREPWMR
jgi:hypothetical protein